MTYAEWIAQHYPTKLQATAMCASATRKMVEAFPELKRVRGWVLGREHWWCQAPDGTIVDPTVHQWDGLILPEHYSPFIDGVHEEAIGMCMNCGAYCFASQEGATSNWCSPSCEREVRAYYGT